MNATTVTMAYLSRFDPNAIHDELVSVVTCNLITIENDEVSVSLDDLVSHHLARSDFEMEAKPKNIASEWFGSACGRAGAQPK